MATRHQLNQLGCELIDRGDADYELRRRAALTLFDLAAELTNVLDLLRAARRYVPANSDGLGIKIDATLSVHASETVQETTRA
jgi:hypothetical protein